MFALFFRLTASKFHCISLLQNKTLMLPFGHFLRWLRVFAQRHSQSPKMCQIQSGFRQSHWDNPRKEYLLPLFFSQELDSVPA